MQNALKGLAAIDSRRVRINAVLMGLDSAAQAEINRGSVINLPGAAAAIIRDFIEREEKYAMLGWQITELSTQDRTPPIPSQE